MLLKVKQFLAVFKIQQVFRMYRSRRRVTRVAQTVYVKYIDDLARFYWRHKYTKANTYEKPRSLRQQDCGAPIKTPHVNESCAIDCSVCEDVNFSTLFCDECDTTFCEPCFAMGHRGGNRKGHTKISLAMCVQCDFQICTKTCEQCLDSFCDSCCKYAHRKGRLRIHTFKWLVTKCEMCHDLRGKWRLAVPEERYRPASLCTACLQTRLVPSSRPPGYTWRINQ